MSEAVVRLVILGSGVNALGLARNARRLGMEAIVVDRARGIACASRFAKTVLVGDADDDAVIDRLRKLGGPGAALIAGSDAWLRRVRQRRADLEAACGRVLHPRDEVLDICLRKSTFLKWSQRNGFLTPSGGAGHDHPALAALQCPVIIRPDETRHDERADGLPKAVEAADRRALDAWIDRFERAGVPFVVTESLLGHSLAQFSVSFARSDRHSAFFAARKLRPDPETCAVGTFLVAEPRHDVEELGRQIVERLDFHGIGEIEFLHNRGTKENYLIEVNPRPWTQYALAAALGFDFLRIALGRSDGRRTAQPTRPVSWIDFHNDVNAVFSRRDGMLRRGAIGWREYLVSLLRARAFAKLDWRDPWPFIVDLARLACRGLAALGRFTRLR